MRACRRCLVIAMLVLLLLVNAMGVRAGEGSILGRVSFTDPEGTLIYGDWVRVFLTTEALVVPVVALESVEEPLKRRDRINSGHMDFFINFQQKQHTEGFVVDHKLTRPDGSFAFYHLPAGRYWIVVTFPTMIAGYKCAWQATVDVRGNEPVPIELNNANLAVPAF